MNGRAEAEDVDEHTDDGLEMRQAQQVSENTADKLSHESSDDESRSSLDLPTSSQRLRRTGTASKSFTAEEEAILLRRLDRRLTLFLALLYLLSFLDRSNIGNARIAGLDSSLSLSFKSVRLASHSILYYVYRL